MSDRDASVAEILDRIPWSASPPALPIDPRSPLTRADLFFAHFPWNGPEPRAHSREPSGSEDRGSTPTA